MEPNRPRPTSPFPYQRGTARLTHLSPEGQASMVDVSGKAVSARAAVASGRIRLRPETLMLIERDLIAKGNVMSVARIAGIQAAKRTPDLIPLCHGLLLEHVAVDFATEPAGIAIRCEVRTTGKTGAEMEALAGVSVAALTIYDMCKAVDKTMAIEDVRLEQKTKTPSN